MDAAVTHHVATSLRQEDRSKMHSIIRIGCATFETNVGMRKLAGALGMIEEGVRRQAAYKDGRYLDVVEYGLLRAEFERRVVAS